ncbi:MAG: carbohydrate kinase family protein [Planctomycetota bacterium]|nr:carbohydrate kinase family protein [Planctomycetota bacterium]
MAAMQSEAVIIGHLCLDIFPGFPIGGKSISDIFIPGKLIDIDGAVFSVGGAANNTGQALHRLGFPVSIIGKVGDDFFGEAILNTIRKTDERLVRDMIISPGEGSSFTLILNPPGIDRVFLHAAATNSTFVSDDVPQSSLDGPRLMHFGYPPLMRNFYLNDGEETKKLLLRGKKRGLTTSLDMARPDPDAPAGKIDWLRFLENVLPDVDVFLPSVDEITFMLERKLFDEILLRSGSSNPAAFMDMDTISAIADRLLAMGPAIVCLKLGNQGFYLKTTASAERLGDMGPLTPTDRAAWLGRELVTPCRTVVVAGTTGAGDSTIAGFLGSLLKGMSPEEAAMMAVGAGGASVEKIDSSSGIPSWEAVKERLDKGWPLDESALIPADWKALPGGVWSGN